MRWLIALALAGCFNVSLDFTCDNQDQCAISGMSYECRNHRCVFWSPDLAAEDLSAADFSGVDLAVVAPDLSGVDFSGVDLSSVDFAQPKDLTGADLTPPNLACALPQLLVTVENLNPGVGQVLRFSVPPYPSPIVPCAPLSGNGNLGRYPEAVTPLGAGQLAVAGRDQLSIVDSNLDTVTGFWPQSENSVFPIDVAPISNGGDSYIAVADANLGDSYGSWINLYKVGTNGHTNEWFRSDLALSSLVALTIDTQDPTQLFIADNRATNPVYEEALNPFASSSWTSNRGPATSGNSIVTMASVNTPGGGMTAWVTGIGVYLAYEYAGGPSLVGPIGCVCSSPMHAVPAPDANVKTMFVLCDNGSPNGRTVQRARYDSIAPQCATVFNGALLPGNQRLTHLGYIYQ